MTGRFLTPILAALIAFTGTAPLAAQTQDEARDEGKAFAGELVGAARDAAIAVPDGSRLPNFDPQATRQLQDLADEPGRIEQAARDAAQASPAMQAIRDSMGSRARFDPADIEAVLTRPNAINEEPQAYTSGMAITGSRGECTPLPPGQASGGSYIATCNAGLSGELRAASCTARLEPVVTATTSYDYYCLPGSAPASGKWSCNNYRQGACQLVGSQYMPCHELPEFQGLPCAGESLVQVEQYRCAAPIAGLVPDGTATTREVDTRIDESQCLPLAQSATCALQSDVCTDASPQTRMIGGATLTRSCWAWRRGYQCLDAVTGNDCGALEANDSCRFLREKCLSGGRPCQTIEREFECALPPVGSAPAQYICGGDVYCIDGSCETVERTANDEFKDAVTALHAMDEARGQFDPETLTLFAGTRSTCSSKIFGVLNCCKGKGFPLIPGISLLVALGCDSQEVLLHERDAQGLCAYVGTYCSDRFLGVCLTKKKVYCCFESRLSRILQEQGRRQLPKRWQTPQNEQCPGFTIDEFARLDLSQMDFSEVYAEFTEAARLPDELETGILIQQKIEDYYARSGQ